MRADDLYDVEDGPDEGPALVRSLAGKCVTEREVRDAVLDLAGWPVVTPSGKLTGEYRTSPDCGPGEVRAYYDGNYLAESCGDCQYICRGVPGDIWDEGVSADVNSGEMGWAVVRVSNSLGSGTGIFREARYEGYRDDWAGEGAFFAVVDPESRLIYLCDTSEDDEDGNEDDRLYYTDEDGNEHVLSEASLADVIVV